MKNFHLKTCWIILAWISTAIADFRNDAVNVHNEYRHHHNSPPLSLDNKLSDYAQNFAHKLANENKFEHSGGKYGENLFAVFGGSPKPDSEVAISAVRSWYSESSKYNYDKPGFSLETGHFTAVVWKNTKFLGIGIARRGDKVYVVASYDPAGNFGGQYSENVLRPGSGSANSNCAISNFLRWIEKDEAVPEGFSPISAGLDVDGQVHHVCTAPHSGDVIPGKLVRGHCYVGYGGGEHKYESGYRYAVSRKLDGCQTVSWVTKPAALNGGVAGGHRSSGELLYVSRCPLPQYGQNVIVPGKIHADSKERAFYPFGGQEHTCSNYDLLMIN